LNAKLRKVVRLLGGSSLRAAMMVLRAAVILGVGGALACGHFYREYARRVARFDLREVQAIPQRSAVYDAHGKILSYIQGENRFLIPLRRVPADFLNALLAREDTRFWEHNGLDYSGIARAAWINFKDREVRQGGSTITQQLARNTFRLTARTLDRKILEAMLAWRIEELYDKAQILECYLNRVYFGAGAYGLQRAAQVYFGKSAEMLTLGECATLVGVIRSPNRYSPLTNPQGAREQRDLVLSRMSDLGMLTPEREAAARKEPLRVVGNRWLPAQESYVMDAVRRDLDRYLTPEQIAQGGLRVYTTIDPVLQKEAEKALVRRSAEIETRKGWPHPLRSGYIPAPPDKPEAPTHYLQAALIAIDNRSGAIRALVGGRDYSHSKYDRACLAKRQVGSTFKPFVYATAFERGLLPGSFVGDWRIEPGEYPDIPKNWSPDNSDGQYGGWMPAADGLIRSRNTMSVRVGEFAGLESVRQTAARAGISGIPPYPASFLGGFETTLRDLTSAYTIFPNGGVWSPSFLIARIEDAAGSVLFDAGSTFMRAKIRVIGSDSADLTSELLQQVLRNGTAARAAKLGLRRPAAGKTGTTNECRDAWFVGYTQSLTCGVWVGFDKPKPIMHGGYGSVLALPIWVDFMEAAPLSSYPAAPFRGSEPRWRVQVCAETGLRATPGCQAAGTGYTADLPARLVPRQRCAAHDAYIPVLRAEPVTGMPGMPGESRQPSMLPGSREMPPELQRAFQAPRRQEPVQLDSDTTLYYTRQGPRILRRSAPASGRGGDPLENRRVIVIPAPVQENEKRRPPYRRTPF